MIINDASEVRSKLWQHYRSVIDDSRDIMYDRNLFRVDPTGPKCYKTFFGCKEFDNIGPWGPVLKNFLQP